MIYGKPWNDQVHKQRYARHPAGNTTLESDHVHQITRNRLRACAEHLRHQRPLIANQLIEKELEDGSLIASAKVGHPNQVLPIVHYWIPHIRIISPERLQSEMEQELRNYAVNFK
ncbi:WYL domain-containing protein [Actimicrobium sp. CCI2.3]|uniref:WYL domain-containing protein n=1 Tax=Actimicrobium sp. CCI2.3 TaxID=3048616 RepID=UPI002AB48F21|nr:WYL domain-containing protein [Actimicrobium sp. CCI2.3]MDY7573038.1 WYL domain-containing protein [Actimicrobium sp. CCI2.3]MEB0020836.1 WYL domain-containing protein [Actimicrobium sp. CCI2.3]